jgi:hypothetical protein
MLLASPTINLFFWLCSDLPFTLRLPNPYLVFSGLPRQEDPQLQRGIDSTFHVQLISFCSSFSPANSASCHEGQHVLLFVPFNFELCLVGFLIRNQSASSALHAEIISPNNVIRCMRLKLSVGADALLFHILGCLSQTYLARIE